MPSLADLCATAVRAATAAGEVVRAAASTPGPWELKGAGDYVTATDLAAEAEVRRFLAPLGVPVLGEEARDGGPSAAGRYWAVDPLDGTTNFLHRFPAVGVSVALVEEGSPVVGAVHAPLLGQTWAGWRGGGAWQGRERVSVAGRPVAEAVVGTGFPFRRKDRLASYLAAFGRALERFEDLRRPGAAALDLAWVAAGVFDGFFELGLNAWDVAGGALLIREAGGVVTDWEGDPQAWLTSGDILAGSPEVHEALLEVARQSAP